MKELVPGIKVYGCSLDKVKGCTCEVDNGDKLSLGQNVTILALHTPCHTKGHISYYVTGKEGESSGVFTGDTLSTSGTSLNKCKFLDWWKNDDVVAEGRWQSHEPKALVNGAPLGLGAVKVFVDMVHEPNTFLWRPTLEMTYLEDSLLCSVAWPTNRVVFEKSAASDQAPSDKSAAKSGAIGSKSVETYAAVGDMSPLQKSPATGSKPSLQKSPKSGLKSPAKKSKPAAQLSPTRRSQ